jgi:CubicO group peptidase (beta-lactamase class C family)
LINRAIRWLWPFIVLLALLVQQTGNSFAADVGNAGSTTESTAPAIGAAVTANRADEPLTSEALEAYFESTLSRQMADDRVVGATVAVVQAGELIFARGYGYANLAEGTLAVADETLFYPGSVGKLFTWTAVMQLVEQGRLDLNADVNTYLDFTIPATFAESITMAHLMTHTAGFEDQLLAIQSAGPDDLLPLRDFLIRTMPARVYPPGRWFAYSNYGTALAGYIVERVSGQPYEAYITEQILEPLAMTRSAATQPLPPALMADYAHGYRYRAGQYIPEEFEWIAATPTAPVRATATDMAHFMIAHLNQGRYAGGRILQEESVAAMHQTQFRHDPWVMGMGYGFMVSQENGHSVSWHTGGSAHFSTLLALIPAQEVGLFISFNSPVTDLRPLLTDFMAHFYPAPETGPVQPPPDTEERIATLAGVYIPAQVAYTTPQKFVGWLGGISVQPGSDQTLLVGPYEFIEVEPQHFKEIDGPRTLTYETSADGTVRALFWGPFAYFPVAWHETLPFQLALAGVVLLIFVTAALAWLVDVVVRRRHGGAAPPGWATAARWTAVVLGLFNTALLLWFIGLLLTYGETFVFPAETIARITQLWWISVPLTVVLFVFTLLIWLRKPWRLAWRIHYTVVAAAGALFLWFLANWHLLAVSPMGG